MEYFLTTLVVFDYDEAIDYYCNILGFLLLEHTRRPDNKRWAVVKPAGADAPGAGLLLAKAATPAQKAAIGAQTGGRVGFFLHTDDFEETYALFLKNGVNFREALRAEAYGIVVVFEDLYGNKWDLIQRA